MNIRGECDIWKQDLCVYTYKTYGNIAWIETALLPPKDNYLVLNMAALAAASTAEP
jgi:hypothetical protein